MAIPNYGYRAALRDRLADWLHRVGHDKTLPWIGLGITSDLRLMLDILDGVPEAPAPQPEPTPQPVEFDL